MKRGGGEEDGDAVEAASDGRQDDLGDCSEEVSNSNQTGLVVLAPGCLGK